MFIENEWLTKFFSLISKNKCNDFEGELRTGVDLGTANIVISVIDSNNNRVAGVTYSSTVVKDGIVVAINILNKLKFKVEKIIGREWLEAATAVLPEIIWTEDVFIFYKAL